MQGLPRPIRWTAMTHHLKPDGRGPDLVLGQICNLPLRAKFRVRLTVIGAADYGLPDGCPPGHYNSLFVVRKDAAGRTPQGLCHIARFAANALMSHSGYGAPQGVGCRCTVSAFAPPIITDAHMIIAVRLRWSHDGRADIACDRCADVA